DTPFIVSSVNYKFNDASLRPIILNDSTSSLIKVGTPLNRMVMDSERSRIASMLEDMGYYQFSSANVRYEVDTLGMKNKAKVTIIVNKSNLSGELQNNKIYRIRNIYINTNYEPKVGIDTMKYDTVNMGGLNFIFQRGLKRNIKPDVMARSITLYPNIVYSKEEINYTSANISNLKYFKSANILFNEVSSSENEYVHFVHEKGIDSLAATPEGYIDCTILCSPTKRQNYRADFEISTNSNYTGLALTLGYGNKNIFKRAEQLNLNFTAAYDFMRSQSKRDSYEFGVSASLAFPRLAAPKFTNRYRNLFGTSTSIDLSYSSQRRPDYDRTLLNASFGYNWTNNKFYSYTFKPLNVSLIRVPWIRDEFLANIDNPYLRNSYQSQMIFGMLGTFKFSTKSAQRQNTYNVRANIETSGNFLDLATTIFKPRKTANTNEEYHKVFGIRYAQYFRTDIDFSYKYTIGNKSSNGIVYRLYIGGGYAYGNTKSIPFERMFFAGGSNSMRGWQVRTLGPGATPEVSSSEYPNQVGDIRLETNIEGRFSIWGPLNGAVFLDLGNVWSNGIGEKNQAARFKWNQFYKQLGLNTGLGARLDFGYFVLR
ncbi:MAG: BamA/TamA family outer membrane protein, partial [Rikenellaceae bacterium]